MPLRNLGPMHDDPSSTKLEVIEKKVKQYLQAFYGGPSLMSNLGPGFSNPNSKTKKVRDESKRTFSQEMPKNQCEAVPDPGYGTLDSAEGALLKTSIDLLQTTLGRRRYGHTRHLCSIASSRSQD
jgi:hypothetical protein